MDGHSRRSSNDYHDLIHTLNQRYYLQWRRAEQLQRELDQLRRWLGPVLDGLRRLKRWLRPAVDENGPAPSTERIDEGLDPVSGRVSIIIPFKDRLELLRGCLRSWRWGSYTDFEIVLVDNGSQQRRTIRYLDHLKSRQAATVISSPGPFNFSCLCNEGAKRATGDFLLFLNNDTEVLTCDWLERCLRVATRPDVGIVGATLLYPNGTIQHAGLHPIADGRWAHSHRGRLFDEAGAAWQQVREVPAVTGACLLLRRDLFLDLGGFDERLPMTYGDVDLCQPVREKGLRVAITPHARLLHFEGLSRGFEGDKPGKGHLATLERFPD